MFLRNKKKYLDVLFGRTNVPKLVLS